MKKKTLGRGKNMSIAKAALIYFYEESDVIGSFIYTGDIEVLHRIVDIAGAEHCGPNTKDLVISCLRSSPYWVSDGVIPGWGNRIANAYVPSKKGVTYYLDNLKI